MLKWLVTAVMAAAAALTAASAASTTVEAAAVAVAAAAAVTAVLAAVGQTSMGWLQSRPLIQALASITSFTMTQSNGDGYLDFLLLSREWRSADDCLPTDCLVYVVEYLYQPCHGLVRSRDYAQA